LKLAVEPLLEFLETSAYVAFHRLINLFRLMLHGIYWRACAFELTQLGDQTHTQKNTHRYPSIQEKTETPEKISVYIQKFPGS
jgi:hypothetical protein